MPDRFERFVAAYLRLNGYFTVPNFIVHAAEDPTKISRDHVGNHTETDIIALRMPYSKEVNGTLHIANDPVLVAESLHKIDVVIAEAKSGAEDRPNKVWRNATGRTAIECIVRFAGLYAESEIGSVADQLQKTYCFENDRARLRYVVFAQGLNHHYANLGVTYITFQHAASFLVQVRGQCSIDMGLGVASSHHQWDDLLVRVFGLANDHGRSHDQRTSDILDYLAEPTAATP